MKIGITALGSHQEKHGPALPLDTDARIAEYIARKTAKKTEAEFLGTLQSSHEFLEINTGDHQPVQKVVEELEEMVREAESQGFEGILIINAHGGNQPLEKHLETIEKKTQTKLEMDSTICNIEGPHAGTGEVSVGKVIGITDKSKVEEQSDIRKYPEVGFAGFEEVREKYEWVEEHAQEVINEGVEVDESLGKELLESAISSAVKKVQNFKS